MPGKPREGQLGNATRCLAVLRYAFDKKNLETKAWKPIDLRREICFSTTESFEFYPTVGRFRRSLMLGVWIPVALISKET